MCKIFSVFCCCCSQLIKNSYFLKCSNDICQRKFIYPKQDQKCDNCLDKCRRPRPCSGGIGVLPRYWIEKSDERIVLFKAVEGFLIATTSSQRKLKLQKIRSTSFKITHVKDLDTEERQRDSRKNQT